MIERFGWAMGTVAQVAVHGPDPQARATLAAATEWLEQLELVWSRFRPTSDVSAVNRAEGRPTDVAGETIDILELAVAAWERTGGRFDPTVHDAVVAAGYDRSWEQVRDLPGPVRPAVPTPGCGSIVLDRVRRQVTVAPGTHLDLGGLGKGRAADVTATALAGDVTGILVNLGGDLRVCGHPEDGGPWRIDIADPHRSGETLAVVRLDQGAVATSSTSARAWVRDGRPAHHLIDPRTGRPAASGLRAVTVVAAEAAWAEAFAKAALIAGPDDGLALLDDAGLAGLVVTDDDEVRVTESLLPHLDAERLTLTEGAPA